MTGFYGDSAKQKLTITSLVDEPFTITDVSSSIDDKIEYDLKTKQKDKEYNLEIKTLSGIEEPFRGSVILKTTSQKKPQITISVMASVKKEIRVAPEYLYFGIINKEKDLDEKSLQRTTVISQMRTDDLKITTIETSQDWIKTAVDTNQEGKQYTITISLDKDKLPQGKFREIVSIHTHSKEKPEVSRIIVEGKVL